MKAIVLVNEGDAKGAFAVQDIPLPEPSGNLVRIHVSHFGLNYADVMARKGKYNDRPPLPCILGYEAVGTVDKIGADVKYVKEGDYVMAFTKFGAYAEYCITSETGIIKLAPDVPPSEATALVTQYSTAWMMACMLVQLQRGDRVMIHAAAGGVGTALVQMAKWKGCEVFGVCGSDHKLNYLLSMEVDHPINYRASPFDEHVRHILKDNRLDVVFDPVGGKTFRKSMKLLGSGGRIVTFGANEWSATKGSYLDKIRLAWSFGFIHPIALLMKSKSVIGLNMLRIGENKPDYLMHCVNEVYTNYQKGILKPFVDVVFPMEEIEKAHAYLESGKSRGKVVIKW